MSRLPFELTLALRYLRPKRTFVSVITLISIIGVTLGVAVLIIVISVMSGFGKEWRDRILGFTAHMKIVHVNRTMDNYRAMMDQVATNRQIKGVAPFVMGKVLVETDPEHGSPLRDAPVVRGVLPEKEKNVSKLPSSVVRGEFDLSGNGVVVGRDFARNMRLQVGDRLNVYSPENLEEMKEARGTEREVAILPKEYEVRGIFDMGFSDYNAMVIITSLYNAQDLYSLGDSVHGLLVMLKDPFQVEAVRRQLYPELGPAYEIRIWPEESSEIFNALASEKNMMFFLLFFIMIVAGFGIVNSQITFVIQKTREIGILKALGATNGQVTWLFLSQSVAIGVLGVATGYGLGMLALGYRNEFLRFMNHWTGIELLPPAIYKVYDLPVLIVPGDILLICGTAFLTCVLAGLFPAWNAGRLKPVEALRYE